MAYLINGNLSENNPGSHNGTKPMPEFSAVTTHSSKSKKIIFIVILIIAVAAAIFLIAYSLWTGREERTAKNLPKEQSLADQVSMNQVVVKKKSKISFPFIISQTSAAADMVPAYLQKFILTDAQNVAVNKLDYTGGKSGFLVTYQSSRPFNEVRQALDSKSVPDKVSSYWTDLASVIDIKTADQDIVVSVAAGAASSSLVTIQSIVR